MMWRAFRLRIESELRMPRDRRQRQEVVSAAGRSFSICCDVIKVGSGWYLRVVYTIGLKQTTRSWLDAEHELLLNFGDNQMMNLGRRAALALWMDRFGYLIALRKKENKIVHIM